MGLKQQMLTALEPFVSAMYEAGGDEEKLREFLVERIGYRQIEEVERLYKEIARWTEPPPPPEEEKFVNPPHVGKASKGK